MELENNKQNIEAQIARELTKKPPITKEKIIFWLSSFKNGDINDIEYQRRIIDTLVNSVTVFDDENGGRRLVFVFNISDDNTRTLKCSDINLIKSSYRHKLHIPRPAAKRQGSLIPRGFGFLQSAKRFETPDFCGLRIVYSAMFLLHCSFISHINGIFYNPHIAC